MSNIGIVDFYNANNFFRAICEEVVSLLPSLSPEERDSIVDDTEQTRFTLERLAKAVSQADFRDYYGNSKESSLNQY